jgi:hypothetical protein
MIGKPRRKRFKVRMLRIEYIDFEVLALNKDEVDDAMGYVGNLQSVTGTDFVSREDCLYLIGEDEITNPDMPVWELIEDIGPVKVTSDDIEVPEVPEYMDQTDWEYKKRYPSGRVTRTHPDTLFRR